jgi:hypothetical protein
LLQVILMSLSKLCQFMFLPLQLVTRHTLKRLRMLTLKRKGTSAPGQEWQQPGSEPTNTDIDADRLGFVDYERSGAVSVRLGEYLSSPAGQKQLKTLQELRRRELMLESSKT